MQVGGIARLIAKWQLLSALYIPQKLPICMVSKGVFTRRFDIKGFPIDHQEGRQASWCTDLGTLTCSVRKVTLMNLASHTIEHRTFLWHTRILPHKG